MKNKTAVEKGINRVIGKKWLGVWDVKLSVSTLIGNGFFNISHQFLWFRKNSTLHRSITLL